MFFASWRGKRGKGLNIAELGHDVCQGNLGVESVKQQGAENLLPFFISLNSLRS